MNSTLYKRRKVLSSSLSLSYTKPLHIVRGSGQFLYDKNGVKYLDGINNIQHVGHAHPRISTAAYKQHYKVLLQLHSTSKKRCDACLAFMLRSDCFPDAVFDDRFSNFFAFLSQLQ